MSLISNIKKSFALTAVLFLFTACGGGGGSDSSSVSSTSGTPLATSGEKSPTAPTTPSNLSPTTPSNLSPTTPSNLSPTTPSNLSPTTPSNLSPTANAGPDKTIQVNHTVTISGISSDSDESIVKYEWIKQSNGQILATSKSFDFTPTGTITKTLVFTVTDDQGATASDTMLVTVTEDNTQPKTDAGTDLSPTTPTPEPIPTAKAIQKGQVKDSLTGIALADVKVSIGESTTTTDTNGFYTLSDLSEKEEAVVNFEKEGYLLGSKKIQIKELSEDNTPSPNYLEYAIHTHNNQWNYNSNDEVAGAHIIIDASVSYESINSKSYNGTNTAELIYFDITSNEGKSAFPGAFKGINSNGTLVQFETYGLISILLKDSSGNTLRLAERETATLRFDAVSSLEKPDTLPLWNYDYDQGLWFEEGYAQLQEDGSYKGDISHLGTWSLNKPLEEEAGIYRGRILDEEGSPISDVRLYAVGENWISSDLTTDEDGVFEIEVIPGKSFQLSAYNYKDKYKASYNKTIAAIASGDIAED